MISKTPLREEVYRLLLRDILVGRLGPTTRLKDSDLARELGVSRTPVREALLRLEQESFVKSDLHRGFSVEPMSRRQASEIYPIVWTLESLAVSSTEAFPDESLTRLAELTDSMRSARTATQLIKLDTRWHETLVSHCPNERLLALIRDNKRVIQRYEYAYMSCMGMVGASLRDHERIRARLAKDDMVGAAKLLEDHWERGMRATLKAIAAAK